MKRRRNTQLLNLGQPSQVVGVGVLAVCIALALGLLLMEKTRPEIMASVKGSASTIVSPIAETLSAPQGAIIRIGDGIRGYFNTYEQNKKLREENATLLKWQSLAHQYARENEQFKKLLNVVPESKQDYITARMVGSYSQGKRNISLISAGMEDGVKKHQAVIAPEGLVGRVIELGKTNANVLLITDINANIPVVNERTGLPAILTGHRNGTELALELAEKAEELQVGDRLATSGDGGMIPPGIPVASITSIQGTTITAAPFADINRASIVTVVDYRF